MVKRLVVDIDDTISFTLNRDFTNAKPNIPLINKLNSLYDSGTEICYVTARGSLSCNSREEAREKYESDILNWFARNNVKYTLLSFDKLLADYYIDDKGITPEAFLNLDIEKLEGGLSGAIIERRGNRVFKTQESSDGVNSVILWYSYAKHYGFKVPEIHSLIGKTIQMDYIESDSEQELTSDKIIDLVKSFSKIQPIWHSDFETYIYRIKQHLMSFTENHDNIITELESYSDIMNQHKSFSHGDLSIDNIILTADSSVLIDPNSPMHLYSSYLLDITKFTVSLIRFGKDDSRCTRSEIMQKSIDLFGITRDLFILLEITHFIRMRKYYPDKEFIDSKIKQLREEKNG